MTAKNESAIAESTDFTDFLREDYECMADEIEVEFQTLSKEQALRIEVDNELDSALKELELLKEKLPKEQMHSLFDQASKNAIDEVVGHFGLAAVVADSKDGGKSTTLRNFKEGKVYNESDEQSFQNYHKKQQPKGFQRNDGVCNYDKRKDEIRDNSPIEVNSEYTGQTMERGKGVGKAQLDHVISVKELDSNPEAHLYLSDKQRAELANIPENLKWLGTSANASKGDRDLMEWGNDTNKDTGKTNFETFGIDKGKAEQIYGQAKNTQNKVIIKNKFNKHATEILDIENVAHRNTRHLSSAIGLILKEFIQRMLAELKILFSNFGNESLKDIFKRFYKALGEIWDSLKPKLKSLISNVLEMEIFTLFSNIVVFIINLFCRTIKSVVRIIKVGLKSLYDAIKILLDKNRPQDERMFAAAEVFVYGLVSGLTILSSEAITKGLYTIPYLNAILALPISPSETIGDALGICISAALGAVLSTIAIYYMDKWASDKKIAGLQIQMIAQSGIVVRCEVIKSWFATLDAWRFLSFAIDDTQRKLNSARHIIKSANDEAQQSIDELQNTLKALPNTKE